MVFLGGHILPISKFDEEQRNDFRKKVQKNNSDVINKIIPIFVKFIAGNEWKP